MATAPTRIKLAVYVDLDPVPGTFSTANSARAAVEAILKNQIEHYNPGVWVDHYRTSNRSFENQKVEAPTYEIESIVLETRTDAKLVLNTLSEIINERGTATVADLYELTGVTGRYTDNKWGWSDVLSARVTHVRKGFRLHMPEPTPVI